MAFIRPAIAPMMPVIQREMDRCAHYARVKGLIVEINITMSVSPVMIHLGTNLIAVGQGDVSYKMDITERVSYFGAPPHEMSFAITEDAVLATLRRLADAYEFGDGLLDFRPPCPRGMRLLLMQFELLTKPWKGYSRWR